MSIKHNQCYFDARDIERQLHKMRKIARQILHIERPPGDINILKDELNRLKGLNRTTRVNCGVVIKESEITELETNLFEEDFLQFSFSLSNLIQEPARSTDKLKTQ